MVTIEEAERIILGSISLLPTEEVPLLQGLGRVIAKQVASPFDLPLCDNSAMDGYAFSYDSLDTDTLIAEGFVPAGHTLNTTVPPGTAVRIMTGAPVPPECDTVVPIEEVEELEGKIRLTGIVQRGSHIRYRGEDVRSGDCVIAEGSVVRPQEIAMLASLGMTTLHVYQRAVAAILATGDELLPLGETPRPGQIVNSNSVALAAQLMEAGAEPAIMGIARDDFEATRKAIREALQGADLLITTGGVSVGDKDFVKEAIEELGGSILFWKVDMKPGKPVAFALLDGKPVFALPGNPVAAMVGFEKFVRPAVLKMMGRDRILRPLVKARMAAALKNKGDRPHLVRAVVALEDGEHRVTPASNQSSANILSLIESNCLLTIPPATSLSVGDAAEIMLLDRELYDQRCLLPTQRSTG